MRTNKRYFKIDQQIARNFVHYREYLSNLLPFYTIQITNPFLNSRISPNKEANCKIVILLSVPLVQNLFWINAQLQSFFFVPRQISMFLVTKNMYFLSFSTFFYHVLYLYYMLENVCFRLILSKSLDELTWLSSYLNNSFSKNKRIEF